jgi:hypothetical protein
MTLPAFSAGSDYLPSYLMATRMLLHDASGSFFSDSELAHYIHQGRLHAAVDTGCLRQRLIVTLPGNQESFTIGGVLAITSTPPVGGVAPYTLVSGANGAMSASAATSPLTFTVTTPGLYYQPPLVSIQPTEPSVGYAQLANLSASATATLVANPATTGAAEGLAGVVVNLDAGQYSSIALTCAPVPRGTPGAATVVDGAFVITQQGSGQKNGVLLVDANGTVTDPGAANVTMLPSDIAAIDQVTCLWGGMRVPLQNFAYTDFSIQMRSIIGFQSVPAAFAMLGQTLFIGPTPNQAYVYELDCILYPDVLPDFATVGQIGDTSAIAAVPYYAAYAAQLAQDKTSAAQVNLQLYQQQIQWSENRFTTRLSRLFADNENLDW